MGTEIRRVIAQKALGCQDKSFWATGALLFAQSMQGNNLSQVSVAFARPLL